MASGFRGVFISVTLVPRKEPGLAQIRSVSYPIERARPAVRQQGTTWAASVARVSPFAAETV